MDKNKVNNHLIPDDFKEYSCVGIEIDLPCQGCGEHKCKCEDDDRYMEER